ncbi:hypothetical protein [Herbaspirillum sp.]|uniref:ComEC/Rec2 family competence protein n=1 Tax=Herbaspirillum sp. TaxID=1890675 RepID=UPI000C08FCA8|nr:hypothetical protein [Herbaspirillum sp.]MAF04747.1 hypothetical protein [Herbaspirillum sp.]
MSEVHLLNVSPGDCTIIKHASGRVSMMDICCGNLETRQKVVEAAAQTLDSVSVESIQGNFRMCAWPSNPINYLKTLGINKLFRFILSHPDMDHMDGLDNLVNQVGMENFWDTGARRTYSKPTFGNGYNRYKKEDWDAYERIVSGNNPSVRTAQRLAGAKFAYANEADEQGAAHDSLHILAPSREMLADPNENDDINEASYIVTFESEGGKIVLPGDAHDASWEYAIANHREHLENTAFLLAPHHGRDSNRSYEFLDVLRPQLTLIGCAPSEHIDYDQWRRRGLRIITSNQAGNVLLDINDFGFNVYVENESFAKKYTNVTHLPRHPSGGYRIMHIRKPG